MTANQDINNSLDDIDQVNKYIFVQDFDKAQEILQKLSEKNVNDYEVLFRRVELATKTNSLKELIEEFSNLKEKHPNSDALNYACTLAKIKSLSFGQEFKKFKNQENIFIQRENVLYDDLPHYFNILNKDFKKALLLPNEKPNDYAAWFVAGCAFELLGDFDEAATKWKAAHALNEKSIFPISSLAELQQLGFVTDEEIDYLNVFENLNKYLVHGHFETHTQLYNEFLKKGEFKNAINALKTFVDWVQTNDGSVPLEIEILFLIGAMGVYQIEKDFQSAESNKEKIEKIIKYQCHLDNNSSLLIFIAQICEDYNLDEFSKMCYLAALIQKEITIENLVQTASHCLSKYNSESLKLALKIAYSNTQGNTEVRFYLLLSNLQLNKINVSEYMNFKNKIRDHIKSDQPQEAQEFMTQILNLYAGDSEIHYYCAEIYFRNENYEKAKYHFEKMFELDKFNSEALLRFSLFLIRVKKYSESIDIALKGLELVSENRTSYVEFHWVLAANYFSTENFELSKNYILNSITLEPWNLSYLTLFIRSETNLMNTDLKYEIFSMTNEIENYHTSEKKNRLPTSDMERKIYDLALKLLKNNCSDIAWGFSKIIFILKEKFDFDLIKLLGKTGSLYSYTPAQQEVLLLFKMKEYASVISINQIYLIMCFINMYQFNWASLKEWITLFKKYKNKNDEEKLIAFEMEALLNLMLGIQFKNTLNLLESTSEFNLSLKKNNPHLNVMIGYCLICQGQIKIGLQKVLDSTHIESNLITLYFYIKSMHRANLLEKIPKEIIEKIMKYKPIFIMDQKILEEIYATVGFQMHIHPTGLIC